MTLTRIVIYTVIGLLVAYDLLCIWRGWPTISAVVRLINKDSGWLFAMGWIVLWVHWFMVPAMIWLFCPKGR